MLPRRKLQFERRPSTRYARRQSHIVKEKDVAAAGSAATASVVAADRRQSYEIDTGNMAASTAYSNNFQGSCQELRVLPLQQTRTLPLPHGQTAASSLSTTHIEIGTPTNGSRNNLSGLGYRPYGHSMSTFPKAAAMYGGLTPSATNLPLTPPGHSTRSIVDIISEFNERNDRTDDVKARLTEPLTVVAEVPAPLTIGGAAGSPPSNQQSKLTPSDSCSSGKSDGGSSSSSSGGSGSSSHTRQLVRGSSPDSGCDVSVAMVAYTSEPKVRRPEPDVPAAEPAKPTPAPRQSLKKSRSDASGGGGSNKLKSPIVTNIGRPEDDDSKPEEGQGSGLLPLEASYELSCPYSRIAIYSLEGSRLQEHLDQDLSDSGQGSSILSGSTRLRSYASSRDILEMYGTSSTGHQPPLTPRLLGFSSSDLRLPPSTLLHSLSGKKSNSSLSVHWPTAAAKGRQPPTGGGASSVYQNIPTRLARDTVF